MPAKECIIQEKIRSLVVIRGFYILLSGFALVMFCGCGNAISDKIADEIIEEYIDDKTAPDSVVGKTYDMSVTSSNGNGDAQDSLASTGTFSIYFSDDRYTIDGDDTNIADSDGNYTVVTTDDKFIVLGLLHSSTQVYSLTLTFVTDTKGAFVFKDSSTGSNMEQYGSFEEN